MAGCSGCYSRSWVEDLAKCLKIKKTPTSTLAGQAGAIQLGAVSMKAILRGAGADMRSSWVLANALSVRRMQMPNYSKKTAPQKAKTHSADETQPSVWQPIATVPPPQDKPFLAAAQILKTGTKEFLYWQIDIWKFDEGEFETEGDPGIWFDDCEIWCPIPQIPTTARC
jgi:hypothetical protein